jgi:hypothetical protein
VTSQPDQIQTLIREIDDVLNKAAPRLPWVVSAEVADQRRVLEQTRQSLLSLQQQLQAPAAHPTGTPPVPPTLGFTEESAQQVLQAFLQEMNYLRSNMLQTLRADIDRLHRERDALQQEVQQLQAQRQQGLPGGNPEAMMEEFLNRLMRRLQDVVQEQVADTLAQYEQEARSLTGANPPALTGDETLALTPRQRLERFRQLQAQSDQLMLRLDSTLQVIFESLQSNIQSYQDSLTQGLEKMHGLGQQGEAMFAGLVNRLAQQLGREASSYLRASLEAEQQRLANTQPSVRGSVPKLDLDSLSDAQIDRLLDELNGGSEPSAPPASPISLRDLVGTDDDEKTIFQVDEQRLPFRDEDDEKTIIQTREEVEAARARSSAAPPPVITPNLNSLDSALDWLDASDDDEALEPTDVPGAIAADEPEIEDPEALYETDDFYNSLFGETAEDVSGDVPLEAALSEDPDAIADPFQGQDDQAQFNLAEFDPGQDETAYARRLGREDDEVLSDGLFGGLSDPAEATDSMVTDSTVTDSTVTDSTVTDSTVTDSMATDSIADALSEYAEPPGQGGAIAEGLDSDLARDESLSGLSTQALQDLFPDNEPLFPDYEADEASLFPDAIADPLDVNDDRLPDRFDPSDAVVMDHGLDYTPDTATEEDLADPEHVIHRLTDLIDTAELPQFLDTSQPLSGDDDRYMPASPDESLIGSDEGDRAPSELLQIDDTTLYQLEDDLSNLENPDSPFPIDPAAALSMSLESWIDSSPSDLPEEPDASLIGSEPFDATLVEPDPVSTAESALEIPDDGEVAEAAQPIEASEPAIAPEVIFAPPVPESDEPDALSYDLAARYDAPPAPVDADPPLITSLSGVWDLLQEDAAAGPAAPSDSLPDSPPMEPLEGEWENAADYATAEDSGTADDLFVWADDPDDPGAAPAPPSQDAALLSWNDSAAAPEAAALAEEDGLFSWDEAMAEEAAPPIAAPEQEEAIQFPDASEFSPDDGLDLFGSDADAFGLEAPGFDDFDEDLLDDEAAALFDTVDTVETVEVDDLLLPDERPPAPRTISEDGQGADQESAPEGPYAPDTPDRIAEVLLSEGPEMSPVAAEPSFLDDLERDAEAETIEQLLLNDDASAAPEAIAPEVDEPATLGDWFLADESGGIAEQQEQDLIETLLDDTPPMPANEPRLAETTDIAAMDGDALIQDWEHDREEPQTAPPAIAPPAEIVTLDSLAEDSFEYTPDAPPMAWGEEGEASDPDLTEDNDLQRPVDRLSDWFDLSEDDSLASAPDRPTDLSDLFGDDSEAMPAAAPPLPEPTAEADTLEAGFADLFGDETDGIETSPPSPTLQDLDDAGSEAGFGDLFGDEADGAGIPAPAIAPTLADLDDDDDRTPVDDTLGGLFGDAGILDESIDSMDSFFSDFGDDAPPDDGDAAETGAEPSLSSFADALGIEELPPAADPDDVLGGWLDPAPDRDPSTMDTPDPSSLLESDLSQYTIEDLDDLFGDDPTEESSEKKSL